MGISKKPVEIIGVKGTILVSEDGKVFINGKEKRRTLIKGKNHRFGYYQVSIENKRMYVHKLVAQAFVTNPMPVSNKMVFHKDGNTLNNHYENLFWGNQKDANKKTSQLRRELIKNHNFRGGSTISPDDSLKIAKRLDAGEKATAIAKEFNVSDMSIARIRKRYCKTKSVSPRYSDDVKEMVMKLLETHRPAEVAKSTGMRYETILRWRNQYKPKD